MSTFDSLFPSQLPEAEIYTSNLFFGYNISSEAYDDFELHCHAFYEIYYFLEGDIQYIVENHVFTPAPFSILIIPPQIQHGVKVLSNSPYRRATLHFLPDILSDNHSQILLSLYPLQVSNAPHKLYFEQRSGDAFSGLLRSIYDCKDTKGSEQQLYLSIYTEALLARLNYHSKLIKQDQAEPPIDPVSRIIFYLNANLSSDISLDLLSQTFCISKHHINKVFKKATGTTIFDYLKRKRIIAAQQLLINGASAQETCKSVGYSDYSAFYRAYQQITGHPPHEDKNTLPLRDIHDTY